MKRKDAGPGSDDLKRKKEMDAVAKHMRFTIATKKAIIKGDNVEYFPGSKAIDCLMDSKWAQDNDDSTMEFIPYIGSRNIAVDFCQRLVDMGYFSRVKKVEVKGKEEKETEAASSKKGGGKKKDKEAGNVSPRAKDTDRDEEGKRKKKKYRLQPHDHQKFVDSNEDFYVWLFNPPSRSTYFLGILVLIGAAAATLYPLWPQSSQLAIYYGSWVLLCIVAGLIGIFIIRAIIFVIIWSITMGKISFWLFPNLNEDLGVIESFKPLYSLKKRKTKKSKKSKDSNENSKAQTTAEEVAADTNEVTAEETAEGQEVNDDNT